MPSCTVVVNDDKASMKLMFVVLTAENNHERTNGILSVKQISSQLTK